MAGVIQLAVEKIRAAHPAAINEVVAFRDETTLLIEPSSLEPICRLLKDDSALGFIFLSDIVGDDLLPDFPRFVVNYHLYSLSHKVRLRLRVLVEDPDEGPPTLGSVWHVATWLEMEVYDLLGISFAGNGAQRRLFLPEDWQGYPLRKDYPLGYEEVQFSFNYEAIDAKKPYAKE